MQTRYLGNPGSSPGRFGGGGARAAKDKASRLYLWGEAPVGIWRLRRADKISRKSKENKVVKSRFKETGEESLVGSTVPKSRDKLA